MRWPARAVSGPKETSFSAARDTAQGLGSNVWQRLLTYLARPAEENLSNCASPKVAGTET